MSDINQIEIRRLDFTLLLVMRALLRHRRTTAVAAELGLSQSAISHSLGRLRSIFGDALFFRRPHGLQPTRRALELAPLVEDLIARAEEALGQAQRFDPATTRRDFRIATLDYVASLLGPHLLRRFEQEAPASRFALRALRGQDALAALRREDIDLAVGQFLRPIEGLEARPILSDDYALVARSDHPVAALGRVDGPAFGRLKHVVVSVDGDFRSPLDELILEAGLTRNVAAAAPSFQAAFAMVAATHCVAVSPRRIARAYAADDQLAVVELPVPLPPIRILAIRRAARDKGVAWLAAAAAEALLEAAA
jgi:DNA-binding transcriptional LysR family regulator